MPVGLMAKMAMLLTGETPVLRSLVMVGVQMTVLLDILWKPEVSPLHIFAGAAVLVVLSIVAYARTWSGRRRANTFLLVMRLAVIAAIATLLMGPSNIAPRSRENSRPQLTVLLDASGSMLTNDCSSDRKPQSRIDCALGQWLSREQRQKLSEIYDVRFMSFSGEVSPLPESAFLRPGAELATGRATNLAQCVSKAILDLPGQSRDWAVLVISDGHDSGDVPLQSAALLGRARNCPIHAVCLGGQGVQPDQALAAMCKEEYLLANEPGQIIAKVYQVGYDDKKATVRLHADGPDQAKTVEFKGQSSVTMSFPITQAKAGLYEYKVSVDPLPGETELGNNAQSVFCQVTDQKIKVLLLEGEPFWETKFLAQSLRKDPGVELTQITRVSNHKQESVITNIAAGPSAGGPASADKVELPKTAEEFAKYDVMILGKGIEQLYEPAVAQLLPDFVSRRGGSIVFVRGQAYDPETPAGRQMGRDLAVIEPVVWGRGYLHNMSLSLTADGRGSPCFRFAGLTQDVAEAVGAMPGFAIMPMVEREKVSAVVLATDVPPGAARGAGTAGGQPGIVQMKYGRGQVIAILGEGLWRWSLLAPDMKAYDSVYDEFWSNTIRTLAMGSDFLPGQTVCLKIGRSSVRLGDPVSMEAVFKTAPSDPGAGQAKVTLTGPDGKSQEVPVGKIGTDPIFQEKEHGQSPDHSGENGVRPYFSSGRVQGSYTPRQTGAYRALLETPGMNPPRQEKRFSVFDVNFERLQTAANHEAMRLLAEQSGGLFFQAGAPAGGLPVALAKHQESRGVLPQVNFLWDKAPILVVLLVWMGAEWLGRRRAGLL